ARQVGQCPGDQVGVDLLDDGVPAMLRLGLHQGVGRVGEHRVVAVIGDQLTLAGDLLGVVAPDPAHDQPGGDLVTGAVERDVHRFGDLRRGDPSSLILVPDGLRIADIDPLVFADALYRWPST